MEAHQGEEQGYSVRVEGVGVDVDFPFEPYECQKDFIRSAVRAFEQGHNALLESPTGTGKTLCLLCSALAWQQHKRETSSAASFNSTVYPLLMRNALGDMPGTIFYASRTHSQLTQVVSELRRTKYKPSIAILGSREQLCVNPRVSILRGAALNHACSRLITKRSCMYRNNLEAAGDTTAEVGIMDIEELAAMGRDQRMCPYFLSRESGQRADLVLMPYNYLFDPVVRRGLQVNWTNSIVIFDEAHNVEQVATDAASCEISTATLGSCITELKGILQALQEGSAANDSEDPLTSERVVRLFTIVNEFLNRLVAQPLIQGRSTLPGRFLYTCFNAIGITITSCSALQQEIEKCVDFIAEQLMSMGGAAEPKLGAFLRLCRCVFRGNTAEDCLAVSSNYKVFIEQAEPPQGHMHARVLHYWCFSPGVALNEVKSLGARCILLTSGTLSPLHSFAYELKQPFPIQLENPHVIQPNQVWVGTFKTSKAGTNLLSTYTNRELPAYKDALGSTLVEILRLVPGGALVFFASYTLLNSCIKRWEEIGLLARLEREMTIIKEPRGAQDMRRAAFDFEAALASNGRAALFAVLRGKASEGIDFRDEKARAVIVTGIPFAPAKDPRVELKRQFLDETKDAMKRATGGYVDGAQWYTQCATRAVNQSIGRVIRHKRDWGAVILLDQRFAEDRFVVALSKWVRPHVQHFTNFESGLNSLSTFFRNTQHCKELVQNPVPHELRRQQLERCAPVSLNTPDKGVMQGGIRLRTVTVDVSALGDDTSFVQPDLLASQPNDASAAALIDSMKRTLRAASNGAQSRGTSHTPCAESSAVAAHSGGASIAMLFQRTTQQRASVTNARTTTRSVSLTTRTIKTADVTPPAQACLTRTRTRTQSHGLKASGDGKGLGLTPRTFDWSVREKQDGIDPTKLLPQLRAVLSSQQMAAFADVLRGAKAQGGLAQLDSVLTFARGVAAIFLEAQLPKSDAQRFVRCLQAYAPVRHREAYMRAAETVLDFSDSSPAPQEENDVKGACVLNRLDNMLLSQTGPHHQNQSSAGEERDRRPKKSCRLVCAICDEQASEPMSARCGHICCLECWQRWLVRGRDSCVLCRQHTAITDLTRIFVR